MYEFSVICIGIICVIEIARFIKEFEVAGKIKQVCRRKHNCKDCDCYDCSECGEDMETKCSCFKKRKSKKCGLTF